MILLLGIFAILCGISLIFNIPLFSWMFGALLIYLGLVILFGKQIIYQTNYSSIDQEDSQTIRLTNSFGKQRIDIAALVRANPQLRTLYVTTKFAKTTIHLDPSTSTRLEGSATWATVRLPDTETSSNGTFMYKNYTDWIEPRLTIHAHVVCGELKVRES